jgi:TRAP-type transport system periplasmic protein
MIVMLSIIALNLASPLAAQTITLQIGAAVPANSPWDLGLRKLAAEWSRISNGRVRLTYPRAMANASQEDLLQKMKLSLDGGLVETTGLFYIDKDFLLLSMPSIITDEKEFAAAVTAIRPIMKDRLADRFELITVAQGGYLHFFSNRSIVSPADLVNARIGVDASQDILMKQMQAIGARTVKSDMSTMLLQFNSNALDITYTSPLIVATLWSQFKRSVSHMSSFRLSPFYGALLINRRSWDRVPADIKPALLAAADQDFSRNCRRGSQAGTRSHSHDAQPGAKRTERKRRTDAGMDGTLYRLEYAEALKRMVQP